MKWGPEDFSCSVNVLKVAEGLGRVPTFSYDRDGLRIIAKYLPSMLISKGIYGTW